MGYPNQPPQGYGQPAYPPQQPQPGQPPAGYGQPYAPPQQGYAPAAPQSYGAPAPGAGSFTFDSVYQQADASAGLVPDKTTAPAIVTESEFGKTQNGKWAWTVKVRLSAGEFAGKQLTSTISISPVKNDGSPNPGGLGMTFKHIHALGVPVGPPIGPVGEVPIWSQFPAQPGQEDAAVMAAGQAAAQIMRGRPCRVFITVRPAEGEYSERNQIRDFKPAQPGDPTTLPQQGQMAAPYPQQAPQQYPGGAGGGAQQGYAQPPAQPVGPAAAPPWGGAGQAAPGYPPQGQMPAPGAAPMTQPAPPAPAGYPQQAPPPQQAPQAPPQGQPAVAAPPWGAPNGAPPQQPAQPAPGQPGTPPPPPWAGGQG